MAKQSAVKIEGVNDVLKMMRKFDKETNRELRARSKEIAADVARDIQSAGRGGQSAAVLSSVRAVSDRLPTIRAGGAKKAGVSGGASVGELLGANFGSDTWPQFPSVREPDYFVFATVSRRSPEIFRRWIKAVQDAIGKAGLDD
jgi:hypothetical protein